MVWDSAMRRMDAAGTAWASLGRNGPNCLTICLSEYDDDADELTFSSRKTCKTCTCGREEGGRACSVGKGIGTFERTRWEGRKVQREGASLVGWWNGGIPDDSFSFEDMGWEFGF